MVPEMCRTLPGKRGMRLPKSPKPSLFAPVGDPESRHAPRICILRHTCSFDECERSFQVMCSPVCRAKEGQPATCLSVQHGLNKGAGGRLSLVKRRQLLQHGRLHLLVRHRAPLQNKVSDKILSLSRACVRLTSSCTARWGLTGSVHANSVRAVTVLRSLVRSLGKSATSSHRSCAACSPSSVFPPHTAAT